MDDFKLQLYYVVSNTVFHGMLFYLGCWLFARKHSSNCSDDSWVQRKIVFCNGWLLAWPFEIHQCRGFLMYFLMTWKAFPYLCFEFVFRNLSLYLSFHSFALLRLPGCYIDSFLLKTCEFWLYIFLFQLC